MVADDSMPMCNSIHAMMKVIQFGGRFLFANDGKEAIDLLMNEPIDLVLLDYNMPTVTGSEVLRAIRDGRKLRDLPVIMITAQAYKDYVAETGESEIDAYLLKPFTTKLLEDKVKYVVQRSNNPPPMLAHLRRARDYEDEGDLDAAIEEVIRAREANPDSTKPIHELGYYYYKKGDLTNAEVWLLQAAKLNPLDVFAFHYLGELYLKLDNIDKAASYFDKAMKVSPRQLKRGIDFGKILIKKDQIKKGTQVFNKVIDLPGITIKEREDIIDFCIEQKVDTYAAKLLENLLDENHRRADLAFKLGRVWERLGKVQRAVPFYTQAAEVDRNNVEVRIKLGEAYLSLKKPILAERPLVEALEIDRGNETVKELLKQCY